MSAEGFGTGNMCGPGRRAGENSPRHTTCPQRATSGVLIDAGSVSKATKARLKRKTGP